MIVAVIFSPYLSGNKKASSWNQEAFMLIRQRGWFLSWQDIGAHEFVKPNPDGDGQRKGGKKHVDRAVFSRRSANQYRNQDSQSESDAKGNNRQNQSFDHHGCLPPIAYLITSWEYFIRMPSSRKRMEVISVAVGGRKKH
jgi:hypothetical protein